MLWRVHSGPPLQTLQRWGGAKRIAGSHAPGKSETLNCQGGTPKPKSWIREPEAAKRNTYRGGPKGLSRTGSGHPLTLPLPFGEGKDRQTLSHNMLFWDTGGAGDGLRLYPDGPVLYRRLLVPHTRISQPQYAAQERNPKT